MQPWRALIAAMVSVLVAFPAPVHAEPRPGSAPLALVQAASGKFGFIDRSGRYVVPAQFADAWQFSEGLAPVQVDDGRWGFIRVDGSTAIEAAFVDAGVFSGGVAPVAVRRSGQARYGFVDRTGRFVIAPRFDAAEPFSTGRAAVRFGDAWGHVDEAGEFTTAPMYRQARTFFDARAAVQFDDGRWGFVDRSGQVLGRLRVDYAEDFAAGRAAVRVGDLWGYVDTSGAWVIEPVFRAAGVFAYGLAVVQARDGRYGVVDRSGAWVIEPRFAAALGNFAANGLAAAPAGRMVDGWFPRGYIDRSGRWQVRRKFWSARPFAFARAAVVTRAASADQWGYANAAGRVVIAPQFVTAYDFVDPQARFVDRFSW